MISMDAYYIYINILFGFLVLHHHLDYGKRISSMSHTDDLAQNP